MLKIKNSLRLVALDFETTGLDVDNDDVIQVGILVCDSNFRVVETFKSLIQTDKDIKELKHIVGFLTGLSLKDLADAPAMQEILPTMQRLVGEHCVLIGQNIGFDIGFLRKHRPTFDVGLEVDTYVWAQSLIHYPSSYSLDVLGSSPEVKTHISYLEQQVPTITKDIESYHDALYDSFVSMGLFRFCVEKMRSLCLAYPGLEGLIGKSDYFLDIFETTTHSKALILPHLSRPVASSQEVRVPETLLFDVRELKSAKPYFVGQISLEHCLEHVIQQTPVILAFHTRQKVDVAKNILNQLGYKRLGFAKQEQYIDNTILSQLAGQEVLADFEMLFLLKYLSHHSQGLGVIDLNNQHDYQVFALVKQASETKLTDIVLCSHAGLYHLLHDERYKDHSICFFDADWWYMTYNTFNAQSVDLHHFLDFIEQLYYVSRRRETFAPAGSDERVALSDLRAKLYAFQQSFIVFLGSLGMELTKQFVGKTSDKLELGPLLDDLSFHQTRSLRESLCESVLMIIPSLDEDEGAQLTQRFDQLTVIFKELVIVQRIVKDNKYLQYVFVLSNNFTDFQEFLHLFDQQRVLFLSHWKHSNESVISSENIPNIAHEKKHIECRDYKKIQKMILEKEIKGNGIFILSSVKHESRDMFEYFTRGELSGSRNFLVENITGGTGKNIHHAQKSSQKIIVGGYYFLLAFFAKNIHIDTIIIYNLSGSMKQQMLADIHYYRPATDSR